jgi:hypothetical protein
VNAPVRERHAEERQREVQQEMEDARLLEEEWQREFGPDLVTVEECSAPMVALFPLPEELA